MKLAYREIIEEACLGGNFFPCLASAGLHARSKDAVSRGIAGQWSSPQLVDVSVEALDRIKLKHIEIISFFVSYSGGKPLRLIIIIKKNKK